MRESPRTIVPRPAPRMMQQDMEEATSAIALRPETWLATASCMTEPLGEEERAGGGDLGGSTWGADPGGDPGSALGNPGDSGTEGQA